MGLKVNLKSIPPRHCGFGTGTQLGLSVAKSYIALYNINESIKKLSEIIGRGNRSGIGTAAFEHGGFLVDGGKGKSNHMPPLLVQHKFPEEWKILVILDTEKEGLHGSAETDAIRRLPTLNKKLSSHLCHETLLRLLPSIIEKDFKSFAIGLNEIQRIMGNYFSDLQGGSMFSSSKVDLLISYLVRNYDVAYGQSSWGPTGFVFFESEQILHSALDDLTKEHLVDEKLSISISHASNIGATTEIGK